MKKINGYENATASGNEEAKRLAPGAYLCKITDVEDVEDREYLKLSYDIAMGEFKDYYLDKMEKYGFWGGTFVRSYKEKAIGFFKGFISAVEKSNPGYKWTWDEKSLIGKYLCLVLGEEEYLKKDNTVGTRLYVAKNLDKETFVKGNIKIPTLKVLPKESKPEFTEVPADDDDDLPFDI